MGKTSLTIRRNEDGSVTFDYDDGAFDKEHIVDMTKSYLEHAKEVSIIRYNNAKETQLASIAAKKEIAKENNEAQIQIANAYKESHAITANANKEIIKELKVDEKAFSVKDYIF